MRRWMVGVPAVMVILAVTPFLVATAAPAAAKPWVWVGTIKDLAKKDATPKDSEKGDGEQGDKEPAEPPALPSFEMKARRETVRVNSHSKTALEVHRALPLERVPLGNTVHVLGRLQDATSTPEGSSIAAQIIQISAVVVADEFRPPDLTDEAKKNKLTWHSGFLDSDAKTHFNVGGTAMQIGPDRMVIRIEETGAPAFKNGIRVAVIGSSNEAGVVVADRIQILSRQIKPTEYRFIIGE